jgi:hypothetical protein
MFEVHIIAHFIEQVHLEADTAEKVGYSGRL